MGTGSFLVLPDELLIELFVSFTTHRTLPVSFKVNKKMSLFSFLKDKSTIKNTSDLQEKESIGLNDLVLSNIFQYVHGEDLKSCRLVCRKWRDISQSQFNREMNIVFKEKSVVQKWLFKGRNRSFKGFFHDFDNYDKRMSLDSFKLSIPMKNEMWYWKWLLLFGRKIKHLTVVVHLVRPRILYEFRNMILYHFQNLESLSLVFVVSSNQIPFFRNYNINDYPRIPGEKERELAHLKKIKYTVEHPCFQWERTIKEALYDIIYAAKNLEKLEINSFLCNTATLLRIPEESLANLRELILTDKKWKYFQICEAIEKLAEVSRNGKLKLHVFTLQCDYIHSDYVDIRGVMDPKFLLTFLSSQKDCLKSLTIHHQPYRWAVVNVENEGLLAGILEDREDLHFPKMEKLEKLSLCNSFRSVAWILARSPNWTQFFPNLKTLEFHYIIESLNDLSPKLLMNLEVTSPSVTKVVFAVDKFVESVFSYLYWDCSDERTDIYHLLRLTKERFPNLKHLEVVGEEAKKYWTHSQHNREDVVSHFQDTIILSSIHSSGYEQYLATEYKHISDVVDENKKYWQGKATFL